MKRLRPLMPSALVFGQLIFGQLVFGQLGCAHESTLPESVDACEVVDTLRGRASYYSDRLAGRSTASGVPYRPRALTAAHRTLPFGTLVRVHRLDVEPPRSVVVEINDRGPFRRRERVLDLSRAAAEELAMIRRGVVPIRADVLRCPPS